MRAMVEGVDATGHEEAGYCLGMIIHRKHPRRMLTALSCLLTEPGR